MKIYVVFREEWKNGELIEVMLDAYSEEWKAKAFVKGARAAAKSPREDYVIRDCFLN